MANDPFEGQDALSLPNRPAHPDPSKGVDDLKELEHGAIHGIVGFLDAKHGIAGVEETKRLQKGEPSVTGGNDVAEAVASGEATMVHPTPGSYQGDKQKLVERPGTTRAALPADAGGEDRAKK